MRFGFGKKTQEQDLKNTQSLNTLFIKKIIPFSVYELHKVSLQVKTNEHMKVGK